MILVQRCWLEEIRPVETRSPAELGFLPRSLSSLIAVAFLCLVTSLVMAQGEESVPQATVSSEKLKAAEVIKRVNPSYPNEALMSGKEGWVILSYTIATDGTVIEPMIEDSSGNEKIERASLIAVKKWEYSPATENDVPVEQSMNHMRFVFQMENTTKGAI